jgi:type IV secretion system protein VirB3
MAKDVEDVYTDPLFVGLTRPATMFGIPYFAFVIEFMVVVIVFLGVGNPLYLLLTVPVHAVLYAISAHDPGIFAGIAMSAKTSSRCVNKGFWGAVTFSPLRTTKYKN